MHDGSGSTFADATCNDNTITASNITWGSGTGVTSPTFNGSTSTAVATQTAITNFDGTKPFSISVWSNASVAAAITLVGTIVPSENYQGWEFGLDGQLIFYLLNNYPSNYIEVTANDCLTTTICNYIVTYDGSQTAAGVSLYIDGALESPTTLADSLSATTASGVPIHVGSRSDGTNAYSGSMSNLQIFPGVFSSGQIAAIQTAGP